HEGGDAAKGEKLFKANCASCHKITDEVLAAPGLKGVADRWKGKDELLVKWIQNPNAAIATGDAYVKGLVSQYAGNFGIMAGQAVSKEDINHIMAYVAKGATADAGAAGQGAGDKCITLEDLEKLEPEDLKEGQDRYLVNKEKGGSNTFVWFVIIALILLVIGISGANISRSLKNAQAENEMEEDNRSYLQMVKDWMWKNKKFVSVMGLFLFCYFFVVGYGTLMDIGVYEGYNPDQPIWFSHAAHVCKNEIDCQYCHSSASKSKHAGIPSVNVCMNCHKGIKSGAVTKETEIAKIYEAIGFDPKTGQYRTDAVKKPIAWTKVHNLPDHVYFNHSQHVTVGKIDCRQCHGPVDIYSTGRQATTSQINAMIDDPNYKGITSGVNGQPVASGLIELSKPTLTMGWCIECHNKAKVDLTSSDYYVEMHERYKSTEAGRRALRGLLQENINEERKASSWGKMPDTLAPSLSVKGLGGWECGKCHY
ncbi:MAG: c-type cytochrome, partial [Bacteroidota bacterium]